MVNRSDSVTRVLSRLWDGERKLWFFGANEVEGNPIYTEHVKNNEIKFRPFGDIMEWK